MVEELGKQNAQYIVKQMFLVHSMLLLLCSFFTLKEVIKVIKGLFCKG